MSVGPGYADRRDSKGPRLGGPGLAIERLNGLGRALDQFVAETSRCLTSLFGEGPVTGNIEAVHPTTVFKAIGDCAGLTAAVYSNSDPAAHLLIAFDERIDDLILASVFGDTESSADLPNTDAPRTPSSRTAIETALVEAFARALGDAVEAGFARLSTLRLTFERLVILSDVYALSRRDAAAAAARFSLSTKGRPCECLLLLPQSFLLPLRKALEQAEVDEPPAPDSRWARLMEAEVQHTKLSVNAILDELPMTLSDLASLRVGTVLRLGKPVLDSVRLDCGGRSVFNCRLGQGDGRYRLEVTGSVAVNA